MIPKNIDIIPVPKPRLTRRDKWAKRPIVERYYAFANELRLKWGKDELPDTFAIHFFIPMPDSWSKKKKERMNFTAHQQRPDIDNYLKAFLDALCEDDSYVWRIKATKVWADKGKLIIDKYS